VISKTKLATLGALLLLLPTTAHSATKAVRSPVYGILTGDNYSGCMVQIGEIPTDSGLDCPIKSRTWVTLDCHGRRMEQSAAANNLRQAQIAILTKDQITITIDDSYKASGWCLGKQIILFR
jgi:hypothetical protein